MFMETSYWVSWGGGDSGSTGPLIHASVFVAVLTSTLAFYLLLWRPRKEEEEAGLPPGPRGMPLLGYLPFLGPNLHRCFAELARTYGPVVRLRLGARLCVVLSSPAAVEEALKDHDAIFANHDVPDVALASTYANDIVWAPHGPSWRMLRKVAVRELLNPATMEGLRDLRRREARRMAEEVRRRAGETVDVRELVVTATLNTMTTMLWGGTVEEDEGAEGKALLIKEFWEVMDTIVELLTMPNVSDFFPAVAWLDLQGLARRMRRLWAWLDRIFDPIIERRMKGAEGGGEGGGSGAAASRSRDLLHVLVELLQKGDPQFPLNKKQVKALLVVHIHRGINQAQGRALLLRPAVGREARNPHLHLFPASKKDMVLGGTDTTSTTVEWTMAELLCNPESMSKAKEEIEAVVGKDGTVEEFHLPKLHYLDAVVKEVARLHPAVPLLVPRCPSSTCTIAGYRIPEGAKVFINAWGIHRDPQFWEDPLKFWPERFLSAGHTIDYTGKSFHYLPFGAGRRICAGIPLAERMVMFLVASLLHSADWTPPEGAKLDLSEKFGIVMKKEEALVAVPILP